MSLKSFLVIIASRGEVCEATMTLGEFSVSQKADKTVRGLNISADVREKFKK